MGEATAARVRAARGYAGLDQKDLARRLSMSTETLYRVESGKRDLSGSEREVVIAECGVPAWFLDHGFTPPWAADAIVTTSDDQVVALIEFKVQQAEARVRARLEEEFRQSLPQPAEKAPAPQGELRRVLEGEPPTREDHPRSGSDQGTGETGGDG